MTDELVTAYQYEQYQGVISERLTLDGGSRGVRITWIYRDGCELSEDERSKVGCFFAEAHLKAVEP